VPAEDATVPAGSARGRPKGDAGTRVCYAAMVGSSLEAAEAAAREGLEVEVIDLRTLLPLDKETLFRSVDKTSRLLIVHEDVRTLGIGAEIAAIVAEERFDRLDAPIMRVTYPDTHCPFSHLLEEANLPNAGKILDALRRLAAY